MQASPLPITLTEPKPARVGAWVLRDGKWTYTARPDLYLEEDHAEQAIFPMPPNMLPVAQTLSLLLDDEIPY